MAKEFGTPGPRAIYPDMCTSRSIARCSIEAQLLFDRLITQADDQGRIEGDAGVIKSLCVPLVEMIPARSRGRGTKRVRGVDELLGELEAEDLVYRYQADRSALVQLVTWWRWQQGQRRAYPSRWAPPEGWTDAVYGRREGDPTSYEKWLLAAASGSAPHNAAWCRTVPQPAAASGSEEQRAAPRARAGTRPPAQASADSGASAYASTERGSTRQSGDQAAGAADRLVDPLEEKREDLPW